MSKVLTLKDITQTIKTLSDKYNINNVYLFGSYARKEATEESDLDLLVYGGKGFKLCMVYAFAEEVRQKLKKKVDAFEIHEINQESSFYENIMKEKLLIA